MRILIVDDSAFMRRALTQLLSGDPELEIVGTARNGRDAIEKVRQLKPDILTMDVEMPEKSGLEALPEIIKCITPAPAVLMCSSLTTQGSHEALMALKLGASDVIAKPGGALGLQIHEVRDELVRKIKAICAHRRTLKPVPTPSAPAPGAAKVSPADYDAVLIGSSTGGPPVLELLVTSLPEDLAMPVVIAQHMPALFTKSLAERLNEASRVRVVHADTTMPIVPGKVYLGVGGKHTRVINGADRKPWVEVSSEPATALYKPSVNELLGSAGPLYGSRALGIVLTGMGDDGAVGAKILSERGGMVWTQDRQSCVVYGMPRAAHEAVSNSLEMTPSQIAEALGRLGRSSMTGRPAPRSNAA